MKVFRCCSLLAIAIGAFGFETSNSQAQSFLIGGYGEGLYSSHLSKDGMLAAPKLLAKQSNASFFCFHPRQPVVYAVSETMRNDKNNPASVVAYRYSMAKTGTDVEGAFESLEKIGEQKVNGDIPCHITTDSQGRYAVVSNYVSGSVVVFRVQEDGNIGEETCNVIHEIPADKKKSNGHCSVFSPDDRFVLVCDLGLDTVFVYELDYATGKLLPSEKRRLSLPAGAGPRHLSFHPNGKWVYIINELNLTMTAAEWDPKMGTLTIINQDSTVPPGTPRNGFSTAEVLVHPSGRFVYGSNRGHDSIALMKIDPSNGQVARVDTFSSQGKTPRNFRLTSDGKQMLIENQGSDTVFSFAIDPSTGKLTSTGKMVQVKAPACIRFAPEK